MYTSLCCSDLVLHMNDVSTHISGKKHKSNLSASTSSISLTAIFQPQVSEVHVQAEAH